MRTARHGRRIAYWDRRAPRYDERMSRVESGWFGESRRWAVRRASGRTLELAAGTGLSLPLYGPDVELTCQDQSAAMLEVARRRADGLGRSADWVVGDAAELPFEDASFDAVVCLFALCCVPDDETVLREATRVVRPGGSILLADHIRSTTWWLRAAQHVVDLVSIPLQGEHYTRRPLEVIRRLGLDVEASDRLHHGAVERVHARRPVDPAAEAR